MPKVTVLLPVYNGEKYLKETVDSILLQSYANFEFLIIDDGSTDESIKIIESFKDQRIRVLRNSKRIKLAGALNRGLKEASSPYIARMDADDIALPDRLQKQVAFMDGHPEIGVCGSAIQIFGEKERKRIETYPSDAEEIKAYALFDCPFCHPATILRRDMVLGNELFYDGSYYPTEDYELWTRAIDCFPTANLRDVLLKYRVHGASMTGSDWDMMDKQAARIIAKLFDRLNIGYGQSDLEMHRNIGRGRSVRLSDIQSLERAESWLQRLLDENQKRKNMDFPSLEKIVSLVWFRLCMNNTVHGLEVVTRYGRSNLLRKDRLGIKRLAVVLLSFLKNQLVNV